MLSGWLGTKVITIRSFVLHFVLNKIFVYLVYFILFSSYVLSWDEVVWSNNVLSKFIFFFRISFFGIFYFLNRSFELAFFQKKPNFERNLNKK